MFINIHAIIQLHINYEEKKTCLHNIPKQLFQAEMTGEIALEMEKAVQTKVNFI